MKISRRILNYSIKFILFIGILYSCEGWSETINVNCSECEPFEPEDGEIELNFSKDYIMDGVRFVVYEGEVEENKILLIDSSYSVKHYVTDLPLDKYYSVKAGYRTKDSIFYNVINGTTIKSKYIPESCNDECWIVIGKKIDLEIKYPDEME